MFWPAENGMARFPGSTMATALSLGYLRMGSLVTSGYFHGRAIQQQRIFSYRLLKMNLFGCFQSCLVRRHLGHELVPSIRQPLVRALEVFSNTFMLDVLGEGIRQIVHALHLLELYFP